MKKEVRIGHVQGFSPNGLPWIDADLPIDVPEALPGERVTYRELGRGQHRARGKLVRVLRAHPQRRKPPCPLFRSCGSCDRMHLTPEGQHHFKQARPRHETERRSPSRIHRGQGAGGGGLGKRGGRQQADRLHISDPVAHGSATFGKGALIRAPLFLAIIYSPLLL